MVKNFGLWRITILGLTFLMGIFIWIFIFGLSADKPGSFFNSGHNAVWAGHEWVEESKTDEEIRVFVEKLKENQIDTVFVHVGPLLEDGSIEPDTYSYSVDFIETAKKYDQDIEYQAWLGQIRSKIDLSDADVRHNIAKVAMIVTQFVGFDGVHYDIEPVWDEDRDFITLLRETRELIPEGRKISVALAEFIPGSLIWFTEDIFDLTNYNSEVNYRNVARYADQVVVMVYDTSIDTDWKYKWLVKEQTIRVTKMFKDQEVFIAIPAYEEVRDGFNPEVENVENGLLGIIDGLNNFRSKDSNFAGVAIYPYWEIEDDEWEIYQNLWIK